MIDPNDEDSTWKKFTETVIRKPMQARDKKNKRIAPLPQCGELRHKVAKTTANLKKTSFLGDMKAVWARPDSCARAVPAHIPIISEKPRAPQFTRAMERKLRSGDIVIDAKLDLHGMTQEEAYAALTQFVGKQVQARKKTLLIITGRGRAGEGALRNGLPQWIQTFPHSQHILSVRQAAPKHGRDGSFYVILKKKAR